MGEYWATQTGRWRRAMHGHEGPSLALTFYERNIMSMYPFHFRGWLRLGCHSSRATAGES